MGNEEGIWSTFSRVGKIVSVIAGSATIIATAIAVIEYYQEESIPDISGKWIIKNKIEDTSYNAYKGLNLKYKVFINQDGKEFTGRGEKLWENGELLERKGRYPIEIRGSIREREVSATFREWGLHRKTSGRFEWSLSNGGDTLKGTFSHTAASSSGSSIAVKTKE